MPQTNRKTPLRTEGGSRSLKNTSLVFRAALESHTVTSQKPRWIYIPRGINSPGIILLWLNSEKPADRQMVAWKSRTSTFQANTLSVLGQILSFPLKLTITTFDGERRLSHKRRTRLMLFYSVCAVRKISALFETSSAQKEVTSFWDSASGTLVDVLICLLQSDKTA